MRRALPALIATVALLASACGSDAPELEDGDSSEIGAAEDDAASDDAEPDAGPDPAEGVETEPDDSTGDGADLGTADAEGLLRAAALASAEVSARFTISAVGMTPLGEVRTEGEGLFGPDGSGTLTLAIDGEGAAQPGVELPIEIETRVVDGVTYQRFPALLGQFGIDAEWLSTDPGAGSGVPGLDAGPAASGTEDSFAPLLDSRDVEVVGREDVGGVETTRYRATVDAATALEQSGITPDDPSAPTDGEATAEVWIDDDGLIRRFVQTVEVDGFAATTTVEILEYGVPVDVTAPPAEDVVDFAELFAGQVGQP